MDFDPELCLIRGKQMLQDYIGDEPWPESIAALEAAPVEVARLLQRSMGVGPLMQNAARCHVCNKLIRSTRRHDFVTCGCGNISVDGGSWYARRVGGEKGADNHIERWPWLEDEG